MSIDSGFTHLHLHSQYSLLDGAIRLEDLVPTIKDKGMTSVAVTDHGNMYGAIDFYKAAKKHGVKPIFGCEAYVATDRFEKTQRDSAHLILLAKNHEGYKNLSYLISMGFLEGYYYSPRIDKDILKRHSAGLFALSACLGGVVNKTLLREGESKAAEVAKEFQGIFSPGHFFLEIQDNGYTQQKQSNETLLEIGRTYGIPMVATADAHYLRPEDSKAHEILMCIQQNKSLEEFRQKIQHSDLLYVRSPEEMWASLGRLSPEALENTQRIAQACQVDLDLSQTFLPRYDVPAGQTRDSYLEEVAKSGLARRINNAPYPLDHAAYNQRLEFELSVITTMGFAGYFLIVWDFIRYAKDHGIPVGPGRGSGAGSLVAWSLNITDLDPIPNDLLFERFLNPERVSMPDFDIDFCQDRRGEVIDYVANRYGKNNVGQIVTYSQLSAKSAIKDVSRVMGLPFAEVNNLTKLIPSLVDGKKLTLKQAITLEPKLTSIQNERPIYKEVMEVAQSLEGLNRQTGIHAAGIVISDKPLWDYVPVCRGKNGEIVTQFAKDEVEEAGLIKFDFLGLKTLTVIANAEKLVRQRVTPDGTKTAAPFAIERITFDDLKVYQCIASGDTDGIFQLESSGFKDMLKRLKPDCFEDIVAAVALYRPGPLDAGMVDDYIERKHGKKKIAYPHPVCVPILKTTYGVIVYQEQVMRIAVDLCGFTMGEADILRKAMGKKKADVMKEMREKFVTGAHTKSGMATPQADDLFTQVEKFAGYAFNKSHSAAYAVITYRTAFLKTYYPVEFMAALVSTEMGDQDKVVKYIQSAREHGIGVLPPDINTSDRDFSVVTDPQGKQNILFGLRAVKGVGDAALDALLDVRKSGVFVSMVDFCTRVPGKKLNRKVLDALIKSGAFDSFSRSRAQLFAHMDKALDEGALIQKELARGQTSLFGNDVALILSGSGRETPEHSIEPWDDKTRLTFEKEALGFYVSGHPLARYSVDLKAVCSHTTASLKAMRDNRDSRLNKYSQDIRVAGVVASMREVPLKSGQGRMAFITLEDQVGSIDVVIFSKVFAQSEALLKSDEPLLIKGGVTFENREESEDVEVKLRADSIELLSHARQNVTKRVELHVSAHALNRKRLEELRHLLVKHKGAIPARLCITQDKVFSTTIALPEDCKVKPSDEFALKVDALFGARVVILQ